MEIFYIIVVLLAGACAPAQAGINSGTDATVGWGCNSGGYDFVCRRYAGTAVFCPSAANSMAGFR